MSTRTSARHPHRYRRTGVPGPRPRINDSLDTDTFTRLINLAADAERKRYSGAGIRIGSSPVVHARADTPWFMGMSIPAPACHSGFGVTIGRMSPVRGEVTCRRCNSVRHGAREPAHTGQMALF